MTIDTNILIAYLSGEKKVVDLLDTWRKTGGFLFLPTIVETELLSFTEWTFEEKRSVQLFLEENFISVSLDRRIARLAGDLRSKKKIKTPDAIIAATALQTKTSLFTKNVKDFRDIPELSIITS